ncbi:MAG: rod shape-determining protein RodA [Spirochaetota bacterium]|nr:rod shape-determining protein RodA [Spirochaetota bacterium]
MKLKNLFNIDLAIFISMFALMFLGVMFIYSSGITSTGVRISNEFIYQIIWIISGSILFFVVMFSDYLILRQWSLYIYLGAILILILTLFFGREVNGSRSWLGFLGFGIQPSEFTKIATILFLGDFFIKRKNSIRSLSTFILAMTIGFLPVIFIIAQPDMGTSLVYIPIFLIMAFMAGVKKRYILFLFLSGIIMIIAGMLPAWQKYILKEEIGLIKILINYDLFIILITSAGIIVFLALIGFLYSRRSYFYWIFYSSLLSITGLLGSLLLRGFLKEYQLMRLIVFLDPSVDPRGTGWHIIQSLIAVGSGGLTGKGFLQGTQSHYRFLPEQSTDFIFSILSEEFGFIGSASVIILFSVILIRGLFIVMNSKDNYGFYIGSGLIMMIFFHVVVNIGMAIGIMPITGIPLLFISYGGSSLWTALISVGLLQNIYLRRYRY